MLNYEFGLCTRCSFKTRHHLIIMIRPKAVPNTDAAPSGWRAVGYN